MSLDPAEKLRQQRSRLWTIFLVFRSCTFSILRMRSTPPELAENWAISLQSSFVVSSPNEQVVGGAYHFHVFAYSFGDDKTLDNFIPNSEEWFLGYAELISHKAETVWGLANLFIRGFCRLSEPWFWLGNYDFLFTEKLPLNRTAQGSYETVDYSVEKTRC